MTTTDEHYGLWGTVILGLLVVGLVVGLSRKSDRSATDPATASRERPPRAKQGRQQKRGVGGQKVTQTRKAADTAQLATALAALQGPPSVTAKRPRDVIIIVLDTVRRDSLGLYGHSGGNTPQLDAWSASARVYENARSVSSWTLPAHASLFTGQYPVTHGAHGAALDSGAKAYTLSPDAHTLAEAMREAGYLTMGIAANRGFLSEEWGLSQGFDVWLCEDLTKSGRKVPYVTGDRITDLALQALDNRDRAQPVLLFLNYMEAHAPWIVRKKYKSDFEIDDSLLPWSKKWRRASQKALLEGDPIPEKMQRSWVEAYEGEIRYLDAQLGRLLSALPEHGIDEDDVVVILSDHGEYLGEHGLVEHSKDLYEEGIAIPMLVRGNGFPAGRDPALVQTQDVPAWVLDAVGLPQLPGTEKTGKRQVSELYYTRHKDMKNPLLRERFDRVRRAYVDGEHKLLMGGEEAAFDLSEGETNTVPKAPWIDPLRAWGTKWEAGHPRVDGPALDELEDDAMDALRALGYVDDEPEPAPPARPGRERKRRSPPGTAPRAAP